MTLVHPQPRAYWGNVNPVALQAVHDEANRFARSGYDRIPDKHGVNTAIMRIFNTAGPRMRRE